MIHEFNVNEYIMVKLTDVGIAELKRQHEELVEMFPKAGKFELPKVDGEGFSKWQLHDLMNRFGHMMIGANLPFETTIRFNT